MIDNSKVKDNYKQGIERVKQKGSMPKGQPGKMSGKGKGDFKRSGDKLTPRKA